MTTTPTLGFEPEPADIAAEVEGHLGNVTDPLERYNRATAAQAHHEAVVRALQGERDMALAAMNAGTGSAPGLSYAEIQHHVTVGLSRSGVQKAVERGRRGPAQGAARAD
ncbi:hypothetical protein ACIBEA_41455 [Streptomyces sp. NPDC051555]|uniref:hypothetical protein n=1 Tax=Streptomyces sp. NPDC051555 TaxID=3365657 RepID=UPI00379F1F0D